MPHVLQDLSLLASRRCRLLFAPTSLGHPTEALERAVAMCGALEADLFVSGESGTWRWLVEALDGDFDPHHFEARAGGFVQEVAAHARALEAELIVVPPGAGRTGAMATALARVSGISVLVARVGSGEAIVAATDLSDGDWPVLRAAAELGEQLEAPVVAIHNRMTCWFPSRRTPGTPFAMQGRSSFEKWPRRMEEAVGSVLPGAEAVVSRDLDPVRAIVREACVRDADVVVVGTRPRRRFERLARTSVPTRVVDGARRSVLVTPIP